MRTHSIGRRTFLAAAAAATAGAAVAFPNPVARAALGARGVPPASDRIVTGHIGLGARGTRVLEVLRDSAGALCDVDAGRLRGAAAAVGRAIDGSCDYRRMLERRDIDAVVVASPDHWHALHTVHACQAGKDVYVETPAARSLAEGRCMITAVRTHGRVVQVGAQGRSAPAALAARELVRGGALGGIERVACWHYENPVGGHRAALEPPPDLQWDRWLGPLPWAPYNPDRASFRRLLESGGGHLRGDGAALMSVVLWCLRRDDARLVRVSARGTPPPPSGLWDCPPQLEVVYEFENPAWTLVWSQPGEPEAGATCGAKFVGAKGALVLAGCGDDVAIAHSPAAEGPLPAGGSADHVCDWLRCIRTRAEPLMPVESGHAVAVLGIVGTIAYRLGRPLAWDAASERFVGDEEANRLLLVPQRAPYALAAC